MLSTTDSLDRRIAQRFPLLALLLVSSWLLSFQLGHLSLSVDEFVNVEIDRRSPFSIVSALGAGADLHPPLSHLLSSMWLGLFGTAEWSARSVWVLTGVLTVASTYQLGRRLSTPQTGMLSALLIGWLSTFMLYTRFVKYYALTMLFAVLVALSFLGWLKRPKSHLRLGCYALLLVAYLYTDYFGPALWVLFTGLVMVHKWIRGRFDNHPRILWRLVFAHICVVFLWLPWLSLASRQANEVIHKLAIADVSSGVFATAIKISYGAYAFSIGETLFPWRFLAILGGAVTAVSLVWAVREDNQRRSTLLMTWAVGFSIAGLAISAILLSSLIQGVPFVSFANHTLFVLPFFCVWIASGVLSLRRRGLRFLLLSVILCMRQQGIINYLSGVEFHNPIYTVPIREIVETLASVSGPNDLVVASPDIGVGYYASRTPGWKTEILSPFSDDIIDWTDQYQPERIWFFEFGRDRTRAPNAEVLRSQLSVRCALESDRGYSEQSPLYRRVKTALFGRTAYRFKLTLSLFVCDWAEF